MAPSEDFGSVSLRCDGGETSDRYDSDMDRRLRWVEAKERAKTAATAGVALAVGLFAFSYLYNAVQDIRWLNTESDRSGEGQP